VAYEAIIYGIRSTAETWGYGCPSRTAAARKCEEVSLLWSIIEAIRVMRKMSTLHI
jgi:hypothetical protein